MKPSAYISDGGILFKESPPDSILKLSPLYTSAEIQALHNLVKEQVVEVEGLKAKPVAWMASNELLFSVVKDEIYHIPLYTHPMSKEIVMNPDILPTKEEWQLICEMVKKWKK